MTFGEQNTEKESHEMLSYATEHGINCIDTAEAVSFILLLTFGEYDCKCLNVLFNSFYFFLSIPYQ